MFSIAFLALPILASALSLPRGGPTTGITNSCNTGTLNCCQSIQAANSTDVTKLLSVVGVDLGAITADVGLTCTPITVIGASSGSCSAQAACCTDNSFKGVVALGCTPVNLGL